jgi:hypothetical protein
MKVNLNVVLHDIDGEEILDAGTNESWTLSTILIQVLKTSRESTIGKAEEHWDLAASLIKAQKTKSDVELDASQFSSLQKVIESSQLPTQLKVPAFRAMKEIDANLEKKRSSEKSEKTSPEEESASKVKDGKTDVGEKS